MVRNPTNKIFKVHLKCITSKHSCLAQHRVTSEICYMYLIKKKYLFALNKKHSNTMHIYSLHAVLHLISVHIAEILMYTFAFMRNKVRANSWCLIISIFKALVLYSTGFNHYSYK